MNKEKLLEWLRKEFKEQETCRDRLPIEHQYWEYHEGASDYLDRTIKHIESGIFDKEVTPCENAIHVISE